MTVVDTPEFALSNGEDGPLMKEITNFLKNNLKKAEVVNLLLDDSTELKTKQVLN